MSRKLSSTLIESVEKFIKNNICIQDYPAISLHNSDQILEYWINISKEDTPLETYIQFSENAFGMVSYGFYKARNNKIYILNAYCNKLQCYYNVDNKWEMLQ